MLVNIRIRSLKDGSDRNAVIREVARIYGMSDPDFLTQLEQSIDHPASAAPLLEKVDIDEADFNCAILDQAGLNCFIETIPAADTKSVSLPGELLSLDTDETDKCNDQAPLPAVAASSPGQLDTDSFDLDALLATDSRETGDTQRVEHRSQTPEFEFELDLALESSEETADAEAETETTESGAKPAEQLTDLNERFDLSGLSLQAIATEETADADTTPAAKPDIPAVETAPENTAVEAQHAKASATNTDDEFDLTFKPSASSTPEAAAAAPVPAVVEAELPATPNASASGIARNTSAEDDELDAEINATLTDLDAETVIIQAATAQTPESSERRAVETRAEPLNRKPTQILSTSDFSEEGDVDLDAVTASRWQLRHLSRRHKALAASLVLVLAAASAFTAFDELPWLSGPAVDVASLEYRPKTVNKPARTPVEPSQSAEDYNTDSGIRSQILQTLTSVDGDSAGRLTADAVHQALTQAFSIEDALERRSLIRQIMTLVDLSDNNRDITMELVTNTPLLQKDDHQRFSQYLVKSLQRHHNDDLARHYIDNLESPIVAVEALDLFARGLSDTDTSTRKQLAQTLTSLSKKLTQEHEKAIAYGIISRLSLLNGDTAQAEHWLERAFNQINITQRDDQRIEALARIAYDQPLYGKDDRSENIYKTMEKLTRDMSKYNPDKPQCFRLLALAQARINNFPAAREFLGLISHDAVHEYTLVELAEIAADTGDLSLADEFERLSIGTEQISQLDK